MKQLKLFMLLAGCKPLGRNTEQHDVFLTIAESIGDAIPDLIKFWPEAEHTIHVDAWREVTLVGGYKLSIVRRDVLLPELSSKRVYFINLGGYREEEFEEFHYKMVAVATDKGEAVRQSKKTAFYKHTGFAGAPSHVDDKYGIGVDDIYDVEDILPKEIKEKHSIQISVNDTSEADTIHLGYFTIEKLRDL